MVSVSDLFFKKLFSYSYLVSQQAENQQTLQMDLTLLLTPRLLNSLTVVHLEKSPSPRNSICFHYALFLSSINSLLLQTQ